MKIPEQILEEITAKVEQYEKGFVNGWETCARTIDEASDFFLKREGDLRKENADLKEEIKEFQHNQKIDEAIIKQLKGQLEIAKEAINYYVKECSHAPCDCLIARQALTKIESAGE